MQKQKMFEIFVKLKIIINFLIKIKIFRFKFIEYFKEIKTN